MEKLEKISRKWWFWAVLIIAQFTILPFASRNFSYEAINEIIYFTLGNAIQVKMSNLNVYFQILSLVVIVLLFIFKNKVKLFFNIYVFISYVAFSIIQNIAFTEKFGVSVVTINVLMFLLVAYVWFIEIFKGKNDYSFANFKWKYLWMIILAVIAYLCPLSGNGFDFNPIHFFGKNSATAFCLMTPLFLTIMTLNLPRINIVTYRITSIVGVIIGFYNMFAFFNPHTIALGLLHIPLLSISLYTLILSYKIKQETE